MKTFQKSREAIAGGKFHYSWVDVSLISSKTSPSSRNPIALKPSVLYSDAAARLVGLCIVLIRDAPNSAISAIANCIAASPIPCR